MEILEPELVAPGYIFIAPYRNRDPGPYIYDNYGNLIWSGAGMSGPKTAHNPHVCQYKGEDHICYFEGQQHQGFARGHGVIMNKHYKIVATVEASGAGASADMHEFRLAPYSNGTTALMTVYQPRMYDLTTNPRFNIVGGIGWIVEGVFQEVEVETGRVVFEWRSLDHLDPHLSYTYPGTTDTSGNGLHEDTPWDYFHINSIDKNADGDYLISARHMAAIYKLSGVDGSIMWEMGGENPTFHQTNFRFSSQHHARWISENSTHTLLRFYDNASNGVNITNAHSHGYIISIDHVSGTATMLNSYGAPEGDGVLSGSQGNMQLLPNGNLHLGWGEHSYYSEHLPNGTAVMYAKLADRMSNVMVYRSNKYEWHGYPTTKPSLWSYSRTGTPDSPTLFYVSWNGATEVATWRLYAADNATGPFYPVANATRKGFETTLRLEKQYEWAFAEALDAHGAPLDRSVIAKTFVPSASLVDACDDYACGRAEALAAGDRLGDKEEYRVKVEEKYLSDHRAFNTSRYYAELPTSQRSWKQSVKNVGVGSLLLGAGVVGMLVFTALLVFVLRRSNRVGNGKEGGLGERFQLGALEARARLMRSELGGALGKYVRVGQEERERGHDGHDA
ncbi:hypothetical protein M8818_001361 [Zalaria obscura]|uniref:Uncharacterized protein n=1 Tax=Zalaria obscura TaxID=2024903 RepID=A0ACC3SL71_9PEZI